MGRPGTRASSCAHAEIQMVAVGRVRLRRGRGLGRMDAAWSGSAARACGALPARSAAGDSPRVADADKGSGQRLARRHPTGPRRRGRWRHALAVAASAGLGHLPAPQPDGGRVSRLLVAGLAVHRILCARQVEARAGPGRGSADHLRIAAGDGEGASWGRDGTIVFAPPRPRAAALPTGALSRVSVASGVVDHFTTLDSADGELSHSWPQFLPDGRHVLYLSRNKDPKKSRTYVQALGATARQVVFTGQTAVSYARGPVGDAYLLYARDRALMAQRFDLASFGVTGEPMAVASGVSYNTLYGTSAFTVSDTGVLAFRSGIFSAGTSPMRQIAWYTRRGDRVSTVGEPGYFSQFASVTRWDPYRGRSQCAAGRHALLGRVDDGSGERALLAAHAGAQLPAARVGAGLAANCRHRREGQRRTDRGSAPRHGAAASAFRPPRAGHSRELESRWPLPVLLDRLRGAPAPRGRPDARGGAPDPGSVPRAIRASHQTVVGSRITPPSPAATKSMSGRIPPWTTSSRCPTAVAPSHSGVVMARNSST